MDNAAVEQVAERWLQSLQQDIKDFIHVVCDDQDLDERLRVLVTTTALYILAPGDVIPDSSGVLGYIDDAIALRVALDEVRTHAPDRFAFYNDRIPELAFSSGEELDAFRDFLGELYEPFRQRVFASEKIEFKGKRAKDVLTDDDGAEWLDDEISVAALKLDFKPSAVSSAARKLNTVLPVFRQKLAPPPPRR